MPKETNAFGLAAQGSGSAVVLNIIFWFALVISIPLRGFNPAYGFAALAGVFLLAAFFGTILLITRGQRHADNWLRCARARACPRSTPTRSQRAARQGRRRASRCSINNRRTLWWAFTWAALNWLLDAACLWVFIWSFGHVISPIDLLVAYGLANILAAIPITPAGLGVVEGVAHPDPRRIRRAPRPGDPRGALLPARELLDPDPHRRRRLREPAVAPRAPLSASPASEPETSARQTLELAPGPRSCSPAAGAASAGRCPAPR